MNALSRLWQPRSVAVVGASSDPGKTSGRPIRYLLQHGYQGRIYPVNPSVDQIEGLACHPSIASLPEAPDVALILLSAGRTRQAVRELAALGTGAAIVLASGYAETGEAGAARQRELQAAAGNMRLLGPNTIGLVNLTDKVVLSASGALAADTLHSGGIGLVSQSGGILGSLLSRASAQGIGFSKLVSTSNEADLELADFVDALADDPATQVIALYVETIRHPRAFLAAAAKAAAAGKPIVAFKIGRSDSGARAAASHTGALAGSDAMYDALFREAGILRARTFADLLDMPAALACGRTLRGKRIAVLTSTGGAGTLVADSLGVAGFETPAPGAATGASLRALQQGDHAVLDRNPIDVTLAGLQPDMLRGVIRVILASDDYDALVVIAGSSAVAQPELLAGALRDSLAGADKPVMAYVSPHAPQTVTTLSRYGVPAFYAPESVASALSALWQGQSPKARLRSGALEAGEPVPAATLPAQAGVLDEVRAKALFAQFSIPVAREIVVHDAVQAEAAARSLGSRVVLKLLSAEITHKSDVGGVAVNVPAEQIAERLGQMSATVQARTGVVPTAFVVQELVSGVAEVMLGLHRDALGSAVLLGMGGVVAELIRDTTMIWLPDDGAALRAGQVRTALESLKTWPLLDGYRGRPRADVPALVDAVLRFARMAQAMPARLIEAEINPLLVQVEGQGVRAVDGVVVLA